MARQQAVRLTPNGHPDKPVCLHNLGTSFMCRFELLGDIADLDEAIAAQQQAFHLTPYGHRNTSMYLNSLGTALLARSLHDDSDGVTLLKLLAITRYPSSSHLALHLSALQQPTCGLISAFQSSIFSLMSFGSAELWSNGTKTFPQWVVP